MKACIFAQLALVFIGFAAFDVPSAAAPKRVTFVPPMPHGPFK